MNPLKYAQMMKYLTRAKKQKPDLADVFPASKATIPAKSDFVETKDAINRFVRDNPRTEKAGGGRIEFNEGADAVKLKALQADYDKFGKKELDKGAKTLGFKDYSSMMGEKNRNKRNKIKNELTNFGEVLTEEGSRKRSREARVLKEQDIQIKLLNKLNTKKFFEPKDFAKKNNISLKTLKAEAVKLRNNIYDKRMLVAGKEMRSTLTWIPDDLQAADNALTKMWKSKLIVDDRGKIENLFYDAFKNGSISSKKYLLIRDKLTEYYQLNKAIKEKYPNLTFELDHPLSKSSLKNLFDAKPEQLIFVNPLNKDLNRGFKDSLSQQYEKAVTNKDLNKKKAVEKIARDLKLNIGKISDDATNFKYGVKEFQKLDMKNEIAKSLKNLQFLNKNFQDYVKNNPELFKTAGVSTQQTFTNIKPSELKGIQNIIASFGDGTCAVQFGKGNKDGGRIGYATGPASLDNCVASGARNFNEGKFKTADQVQDAAKLLRGGRAVVSGLMKYGIIPELAYVGLEAAGRTLLGEKPTNALLKSIDTLTFGATDFGSGIEAEKFGKFSDQKLAVDKFRNSQALVNSLQNKLENLKAITDRGGEGYVGDLTSDIQTTQAQLQAAEQELQKNTVSPDLVQFIDRRGQEIADTQMAKSNFAKQSLKDQMEGIPGIRDYTDTESTRIFPSQPSQVDLNLNMFPTLPTDFMQLKTSDAIDLAQAYREQGENVSAKDILAYRDELKKMPLSEQAQIYGDEQTYGTQGAEALRPLAGGGIAKLAGVSSGPPPESGPNSQGLQGLMKRVRNI